MPTATVTSKGQITVSRSIRLHFKLEPGDRLRFVIERLRSCASPAAAACLRPQAGRGRHATYPVSRVPGEGASCNSLVHPPSHIIGIRWHDAAGDRGVKRFVVVIADRLVKLRPG